jgi:hypothetical protein
MESQHADANEELLLELTSKNTTRSIKDFSPEGIRLESNLEGEAKGVGCGSSGVMQCEEL